MDATSRWLFSIMCLSLTHHLRSPWQEERAPRILKKVFKGQAGSILQHCGLVLLARTQTCGPNLTAREAGLIGRGWWDGIGWSHIIVSATICPSNHLRTIPFFSSIEHIQPLPEGLPPARQSHQSGVFGRDPIKSEVLPLDRSIFHVK